MRIAIFASGGGTNFQAIADSCVNGSIDADVVLCVTTSPDAGVIGRAESLDIPTHVLGARPPDDADEILSVLSEADVDFVCLAGYMRKIPAEVVSRFQHRMLNIHPALLPAFGGKGLYGMRVHRAVIEYGVRFSGATVHLVDEQYDTGPVVLQDIVPVNQSDTPESLADRVLQVEHALYPKAVRLFAENRIRVEGRRVFIQSDS